MRRINTSASHPLVSACQKIRFFLLEYWDWGRLAKTVLTPLCSGVLNIIPYIEYLTFVKNCLLQGDQMVRRPIEEPATVKIGGVVVSALKAYRDTLEVLLVIKTKNTFYAVVLTGRRAYQAAKLPKGQWVEVKGQVVELLWAADIGWKIPFSVSAHSLRIGSDKEDVLDPFSDIYELSKGEIFRNCFEMSLLPPVNKVSDEGEIN